MPERSGESYAGPSWIEWLGQPCVREGAEVSVRVQLGRDKGESIADRGSLKISQLHVWMIKFLLRVSWTKHVQELEFLGPHLFDL